MIAIMDSPATVEALGESLFTASTKHIINPNCSITLSIGCIVYRGQAIGEMDIVCIHYVFSNYNKYLVITIHK